MTSPPQRLIIVSNRLPVAVYDSGQGWAIKPSPGGLVTALAPTMKKMHGLWIGWPGCSREAPARQLLLESEGMDYRLEPVELSDDEIARYYRGFANKSIWPLFHDLLGQFSFSSADWHKYIEVNRRFAETVAAHTSDSDFIWVHDYQLILVGKFLREIGLTQQLSFFLHIPFPSLDLFRRMPANQELIEALLEYEHVGVQTAQDRRNFIQCIKWFLPDSTRQNFRRHSIIKHNGHQMRLGHYPISIDFEEFNEQANDSRVADAAWYLHENQRSRKMVLGLDRLDYTKGIPERFSAFERLLEKYPDTHGKIALIQIVVPSRIDVAEYQDLKTQLDGMSGRINGRFSKHGWIPIHYLYRELDRVQLLGHYRACEIGLITPLRDGMNLVAKEYCAASVDNQGVLILSEFAGAARQLAKGAIIVNPYDIESTADAIYAAYIMPEDERRRRMRAMRSDIKRNDVRRWVNSILKSDLLE
ncbi:MAG: trehalose-6-phosphate synthase [Candidatus Zixiibacteriota bacterium]